MGASTDYMVYENIIWTFPGYELSSGTSPVMLGRLGNDYNLIIIIINLSVILNLICKEKINNFIYKRSSCNQMGANYLFY